MPPPIFIGRTRPDQAGAARIGPELARSSPDFGRSSPEFDRNIPEVSRNSPEMSPAEEIRITIKISRDTSLTEIRPGSARWSSLGAAGIGSHRSFSGGVRFIEDYRGLSRNSEEKRGKARNTWDCLGSLGRFWSLD